MSFSLTHVPPTDSSSPAKSTERILPSMNVTLVLAPYKQSHTSCAVDWLVDIRRDFADGVDVLAPREGVRICILSHANVQ